jgi:hypothetical protein
MAVMFVYHRHRKSNEENREIQSGTANSFVQDADKAKDVEKTSPVSLLEVLGFAASGCDAKQKVLVENAQDLKRKQKFPQTSARNFH